MNKRGFIGKIFLAIGLLVLLILAVAGFTAWQAYSLVKTVASEGAVIGSNMALITAKGSMLNKTDCERIPEIEASAAKVKSKAESSCKNPIIKIAVDKMPQMKIKCSDIPTLEVQMTKGLASIKIICANETLMNQLQAVANQSATQ